MTCREILSAALDGEAVPEEIAAADAHRRSCIECQAAVAAMTALDVEAAAAAPDLVTPVLAATVPRPDDDRVVWRWGLLFVAVAQLLAAAVHVGADHVLRDQAAWEAALAAGFAWAAWKPDRSTGLVPVSIVLSVLLLVNSGFSFGGGGVHHLLAPVGTVFLVLLTRPMTHRRLAL